MGKLIRSRSRFFVPQQRDVFTAFDADVYQPDSDNIELPWFVIITPEWYNSTLPVQYAAIPFCFTDAEGPENPLAPLVEVITPQGIVKRQVLIELQGKLLARMLHEKVGELDASHLQQLQATLGFFLDLV
jgi:hypothetical protein